MKNPLLGAAFTVLVFWWVVLTFWFTDFRDLELGDVTYTLMFIVIGTLIGASVVLAVGKLDRSALEARLAARNLRGLSVSLGMLPLLKRAPKRAAAVGGIDTSAIPEITAPDFLQQWRKRWQADRPHHVAMVDALLRILQTKPDVPATHAKDGHGGRSLLQHTLLTAFMMLTLAPSWTWQGNRNRRNRTILIPLRNPAYKFEADDPLLLIAAMAHDVGKLECYVFDKDGKVVGSKHEHDIVSSQMLARMPELWELPDSDRDVLLLAIGHYHHPSDMPMDDSNRVIDDRLMAVTELLIFADKVASKLEQGAPLAEAQVEDEGDTITEGKQDTLLTVFSDIVTEAERINGSDRQFRVGQKTHFGGKPYLVLYERDLMKEIGERTGLDYMTKLGNGEFRLTRDLLTALDEQKVLYKVHEGKEYGAFSALWKIEFRKKNGDHLADWPAAIIVEINDTFLPGMLALEDADVIALIRGPLHGEQRAKRGAGVTGHDLEALLEVSEEDMAGATTLQKGTKELKAEAAAAQAAAARAAAPPVPPAAAGPAVQPDGVGAEATAPPESVADSASDDGINWDRPPSAPADALQAGPDTQPADVDTGGGPGRDPWDPPAAEVPEPPPAAPAAAQEYGLADRVFSEAVAVCEQLAANSLPKAGRVPDEEGVWAVRATNLTPVTPTFSWVAAVPTIKAGAVPGVRCVVETPDEGGDEVVILLFNVQAVLAGQGAATAFQQTGAMPVRSKEAADEPF